MKKCHYDQLEQTLRYSKADEPVQIICPDKKWFKTCERFIEYFKEVHPEKDLSLIILTKDKIEKLQEIKSVYIMEIKPCEKEKVKSKGEKSAR